MSASQIETSSARVALREGAIPAGRQRCHRGVTAAVRRAVHCHTAVPPRREGARKSAGRAPLAGVARRMLMSSGATDGEHRRLAP